jgi:hypothetical protein
MWLVSCSLPPSAHTRTHPHTPTHTAHRKSHPVTHAASTPHSRQSCQAAQGRWNAARQLIAVQGEPPAGHTSCHRVAPWHPTPLHPGSHPRRNSAHRIASITSKRGPTSWVGQPPRCTSTGHTSDCAQNHSKQSPHTPRTLHSAELRNPTMCPQEHTASAPHSRQSCQSVQRRRYTAGELVAGQVQRPAGHKNSDRVMPRHTTLPLSASRPPHISATVISPI